MSWVRAQHVVASSAVNDAAPAAAGVLLLACGDSVHVRAASGATVLHFRAMHQVVSRVRSLAFDDSIVTIERENDQNDFLCTYHHWRTDQANFAGHTLLLGGRVTAFETCRCTNTIAVATTNVHPSIDIWSSSADGLIHLLEVDAHGLLVGELVHMAVHWKTLVCGSSTEVRLVQLDISGNSAIAAESLVGETIGNSPEDTIVCTFESGSSSLPAEVHCIHANKDSATCPITVAWGDGANRRMQVREKSVRRSRVRVTTHSKSVRTLQQPLKLRLNRAAIKWWEQQEQGLQPGQHQGGLGVATVDGMEAGGPDGGDASAANECSCPVTLLHQSPPKRRVLQVCTRWRERAHGRGAGGGCSDGGDGGDAQSRGWSECGDSAGDIYSGVRYGRILIVTAGSVDIYSVRAYAPRLSPAGGAAYSQKRRSHVDVRREQTLDIASLGCPPIVQVAVGRVFMYALTKGGEVQMWNVWNSRREQTHEHEPGP
jgi:hypothetical protein